MEALEAPLLQGRYPGPQPTIASALSSSVSWYGCSGSRFFPHGPFSATRCLAEPCSLLSGAPAHGGRSSFNVRAKWWETDRDSCLPMSRPRKAITSREQQLAATVAAERAERTTNRHDNTTSECTVNLHPPPGRACRRRAHGLAASS